MDDAAGAAPAAAEQPSLPIEQAEPVQVPNPIESKGPTPDVKPETKPSTSISEALKKAEAKVKADATAKESKEAPKAEPKADKPEVKLDGPARGEDGKFASKDAAKADAKPAEVKVEPNKETPFREAPKRFSEDAKAAWEKAPDPVKAEAHRAIKELESGINEYRQKYEPLKQYDDLARQNNTSIKDALDRYTGLERSLTSGDPNEKFSAIQKVFDYAGINMRDFAAQLAGVTPDQTSVHYESQMQTLRQRNAELEHELAGYRGEKESQIMSSVEKFAQDHPRFDELSGTITKFLEQGFTSDLQEAYDMAERLKPAPVQASTPSPVIPEPPEAHTLRGQKSIAGAPSPGSSPPRGKASPSIKEALQRAMAQAG